MSDDNGSRKTERGGGLEEELGEVSEEELAESSRLAKALESPQKQGENALGDFAESLRVANAPRGLEKDAHEKIIAATLSKRAPELAANANGARRGRVIRVAFGVSAIVAIAAALVLFLTRPKPVDEMPMASLVRSRSTSALFTEPFKALHPADATARIDRIASARERDYRENLFAMRGAR